MQTNHEFSIENLLKSMSKAECTYLQQNYYLCDYYDDVLEKLEQVYGIPYSSKILSLGEIKKFLAYTKKSKKHYDFLTKRQAPNPMYLLGLRAFLLCLSAKVRIYQQSLSLSIATINYRISGFPSLSFVKSPYNSGFYWKFNTL